MNPKTGVGWKMPPLDENILFSRINGRDERIFASDDDFLRDYLGELPQETGEPGHEEWRDADEIESD